MGKEKIEFDQPTKIGQKIYYVQVNIRSAESMHNSTSMHQNGIFITEKKIAYQTIRKIALNDEWITILDRKRKGQRKESYYRFLEEVCISIKTKETYWPNGIFASVHTTKDPEKMIGKIKKMIIKKIEDEYGFLRNIDVESVIMQMNPTKL